MRVRTHCRVRFLPALLAALGVAAGSAPRAHAAAYTYASRQRTINAGVLILDDSTSGNTTTATDGTVVPYDPTPYVFYIMNERQDLKPFGWNIVNPIAPATVTGDIRASWNNRVGGSYGLNQTITPNMGAYWEVSLSKTSLTDLEKFDVLLLNISRGNEAFTDNEVNTLRRYVDNGGQLWIEGTGGTINATDSLFLSLSFNTSQTAGYLAPPGLPQPVIASPYLLQPYELNALGGAGAFYSNTGNGGSGSPDTSILSTVAASGGKPVISAGQYGAGQVIVDSAGSATSINDTVPGGNYDGPNSGPYCDPDPQDALSVPAADLKFAFDILTWSGAHPNEYKTSHQSSDSAATLGPALTPTWTYTPPNPPNGATGTSTPGAAINGNFVYVRTADGVLRAFNATPGTDILGTGVPDAGRPDYSNGSPYDEVWDTNGNGFPNGPTPLSFSDPQASAPTVANVPTGKTDVFIESAKGQVYAADATTGAADANFGTGGLVGPPQSPGTFPTGVVAPAPTYFDGHLYAAEPDGSLFVYDFGADNGGAAASKDYDLGTTGEHAVAPPTVGLVHESLNAFGANTQNGSGYADDIVVTVTTDAHTYTVHVGARHDPLLINGSTDTPQQANINTSNPPNFDILAVGTDPLYFDNGLYQSPIPYALTPPATAFTAQAAQPPLVFGDDNVDFVNTAPGLAVRALFGLGTFSPAVTTGNFSPPALDSNGNFYYTLNVQATAGTAAVTDSTLVCVHEGRSGEAAPPGRASATQMLWRFRLPYALGVETTPVDADGNSYAGLAGYQFVGQPVVDTQGNVFALAANAASGSSAVLCFNATYSPYITFPVTSANGIVTVSQITQPVLTTGGDEFGNAAPAAILNGTQQFYGQLDNNGGMNVQSFGAPTTPAPANGAVLTPNLSEPQSVQGLYTQNTTAGNTPPTLTTGLFHTNLNWYALLPNTTLTAGAGLTQVGNYLFFPGTTTATTSGAAQTGVLRLYAYPQGVGLVSGKAYQVLSAANQPNQVQGRPDFFLAAATPQIGAVQGVLSAGNGVLVANGTAGVEAFGTKYSLVADANRVLEVDNEGTPSWLVDSTSEINPITKHTTHVALNHPSAITQVTPNDYLIADTGNNRCVRFDRAGNVIWELTRFNDQPLLDSLGNPISFFTNTAVPNSATNQATKQAPLLVPGEPTTLNHPTSVDSYIQTVNSNGVGTIVHYLIADTGNHRIVEVVDAFDPTGKPIGVPHDLVWVSRTYDALGRRYDYTSANYFVGPGGLSYIAALVSNVRIAGPIPGAGQMLPARQDAPGGSIVLLDYDPGAIIPIAQQKDGYIHQTVNSFLAFFKPNGIFDLGDSSVLEQINTNNPVTYGYTQASGTASAVTLRNPRYMQTYSPPGSVAASGFGPPLKSILLADDNGVWDLFFNKSSQLQAQWGFQGRVQVSGSNTAVNGAYIPNDGAGDCSYLLNGNPGNANQTGYGLYYTGGTWQLCTASGGSHGSSVVSETSSAISPTDPSGNYGNGTVSVALIPFLPNSLQRIGTDPVAVNGATGSTDLLGHYLVTNGFSTGEVTPVSGYGGEVMELADQNPLALQTNLASSFSTLGGIASPLSQPAFATQER